MKITYKNRKIEKVCNSPKEARKVYGNEMAIKISQCLMTIRAVNNVDELVYLRLRRCHPLKGNCKNQYSMDLVHPYRPIFEKKDNDIHIVNIIEIIDYH